jgi:hypothetical protein
MSWVFLWGGKMPLPTASEMRDRTKKHSEVREMLAQSIEHISNNVANKYETIPFKSGINIFDKTKIEIGKYYSYVNGSKGETESSFAAAGPIKVEPNTLYRVPESHSQQYALFDSNMRFIKGSVSTKPNSEIITPANARFLGITLEVSELDNFMISKAEEYPNFYEPFTVIAENLRIQPEQNEGLSDYIKNTLEVYSTNIVDKTKIVENCYVDYQTGKIQSGSGYLAAGPYDVLPNVKYRFSQNYEQQFAFYDENHKYISGYARPQPDQTIVTPANARFIKLTVDSYLLDALVVAESSKFTSENDPYAFKFKNLKVDIDQVLNFNDALFNSLGFNHANIIQSARVVENSYVNHLNGEVETLKNFFAFTLCNVKPNSVYVVNKDYDQQFAFYDENHTYISGQPNAGTLKEFTTPVNCYYVSFTVAADQVNNLLIIKKDLSESLKERTEAVFADKLVVESSQVSDIAKFIDNTLGAESINIVDPSKKTEGFYVDYNSGVFLKADDFCVAGPYEVNGSTTYKINRDYYQQFAFYDENHTYISGQSGPSAGNTFTTPVNAKYVALTVLKKDFSQLLVAKENLFPAEYVSNDIKLVKNLVLENTISTTEIWVSADLNDLDTKVKFRGANAIQLALNSIERATATNRYVIRVKQGVYRINKAKDFIGYPGYPSMIEMKDHIDIVGQGQDNTIIWAELPYNDEDIGPSANGVTYPRVMYQTLYHYAKDAHIKDMTFIAQNLRYTLHQDDSRGAFTEHKYQNVGFIFKGDKGAINPLGIGTANGEETYMYGGFSHSDVGHAFACHNNIQFTTPSSWNFENFNFTSISNKYGILMQSDGSLLQDKLKLVGCSFGGAAYTLAYVDIWLTGDTSLNRDSFNHAEWLVYGHGNEPFLFDNIVNTGLCLRFKSNATGLGKTIRFDTSSSAFPILIKNNHANSEAAIYTNSREYLDGYIVQDGSLGLPAIAYGCKDLTQGSFTYDNGVNFTSLSTRLGDCRNQNKELKLTVDGVINTVIFNQNYSGMSNQDIVNSINSQLTNVVADLHVYGRDYYANITDVCEVVYNWKSEPNAVQEYIAKGSLVTKRNGTVRKAEANDKVYGVALDDIPVMHITSEGVKKGQGRVMKRGYIFTDRSKAHYVLSDNQTPSVGTRFKVSNGQLLTDVNGKISVDMDDGVVSINC